MQQESAASPTRAATRPQSESRRQSAEPHRHPESHQQPGLSGRPEQPGQAGPSRPRTSTPTGPRHRPDTDRAVSTPEAASAPGVRPDPDHRNEILVAGRITAEPFIRELPSGDRLATWRICVARPSDSRYGGRRADSVTCTSFDRDLHERVRLWRRGDVVRMTGELRRRTWRGHEGVRSICEVEARTATLVRAVGNHTAAQR